MPSATPQQRIFWTQHQGQPYLMLDFSHATVAESLALMDHFAAAIKDHPPLSVRMLTDVTEAQYEPSVANKWKAIRILYDPLIKASAIYGLSGLVGVAIRALLELFDMLGLNRGQKKLRIFKNRESALTWLMKA